MSDDTTSSSQVETGVTLRRGTLGLRHAIVISVAVMSPAASIFFNTIPQAGFVGAAIPLCYVIGFMLALLIALPLTLIVIAAAWITHRPLIGGTLIVAAIALGYLLHRLHRARQPQPPTHFLPTGTLR